MHVLDHLMSPLNDTGSGSDASSSATIFSTTSTSPTNGLSNPTATVTAIVTASADVSSHVVDGDAVYDWWRSLIAGLVAIVALDTQWNTRLLLAMEV